MLFKEGTSTPGVYFYVLEHLQRRKDPRKTGEVINLEEADRSEPGPSLLCAEENFREKTIRAES